MRRRAVPKISSDIRSRNGFTEGATLVLRHPCRIHTLLGMHILFFRSCAHTDIRAEARSEAFVISAVHC